MKERIQPGRIELPGGATVGVIGGGPAGAFFAIQVLRKAKELDRNLKVIVFEREQSPGPRSAPCLTASRSACNYCAGGLSAKLNDVLQGLDLKLPEEIIQSRIHSLTIQGFWKNIQLEVPTSLQAFQIRLGRRVGFHLDGLLQFGDGFRLAALLFQHQIGRAVV